MSLNKLFSLLASLAFLFVISSRTIIAADQSYPITVNYDMTVEELAANGNYNWVNKDISSRNFQTLRSGTVDVLVELVHLSRVASTSEVLKELDSQGYRPAEFYELLTFGIKYSGVTSFAIVALGSVWIEDSYSSGYSTYITSDGMGKRFLNLYRLDDIWSRGFRFLAVRKPS